MRARGPPPPPPGVCSRCPMAAPESAFLSHNYGKILSPKCERCRTFVRKTPHIRAQISSPSCAIFRTFVRILSHDSDAIAARLCDDNDGSIKRCHSVEKRPISCADASPPARGARGTAVVPPLPHLLHALCADIVPTHSKKRNFHLFCAFL